MNARDLLEKYGRGTGISLKAIRIYARHICAALAVLRRCKIIHGDVKPDNILISSTLNTAKLGDFGSAVYSPCSELTCYFASRYYRAPEIILKSPAIGCEADMWSLGCTLYELYTAQVPFPGKNNNEMLLLMMRTLGKFPNRMLRRAGAVKDHFDPSSNFCFKQRNIDGSVSNVSISAVPQTPFISKLGEEDNSEFLHFLQEALKLTPETRLTPMAALSHSFLKT